MLDAIKRIIKEKSSLILLCMLTAYTIFACLSDLSLAFIVLMYIIVIVSPFIFDDTYTLGLYCYSACFMSCFGWGDKGYYLAFGVSSALLMIKKVVIALKEKQAVSQTVKISVLWLSLAVIYTAYTLIVNGIDWRRTGIGLDMLQTCVLAFLLRKTVDYKRVLVCLWLGIIASFSIAYIFCMEGARHEFITGYVEYRFGAFFNNENTMAVYCTFCSSCFIALILSGRIEEKKYIICPFVATLIGLFVVSKAFILLNIVLYIAWIIIGFIKAKKKLYHAIFVGIALIIVTILCLIYKDKVEFMLNRFYGKNDGNFWDHLTTGRMDIWKEYIANWLSSPRTILFGNGFTAPKISSGYYEHNVYIAFLNQYGILGSAILVFAAVYTVKQSCVMERRFSAYIPFILFLFNGISSNLSGTLCTCLPWLLAVCIFSYSPQREESQTKSVESEIKEEKIEIGQ